MNKYPVIDFHQYGGNDSGDRLLLFAAKAKDLARWAGIPRKGWRVRMLFQRWITAGRETELKEFWTRASNKDSGEFVLGPSAIVIAIQGEPTIVAGEIVLEHKDVLLNCPTDSDKLLTLANLVLPRVTKRLDEDDRHRLQEFSVAPYVNPEPQYGHNYVMEFCIQLTQILADPDKFVSAKKISLDEVAALIESLEAICRPAIIVDGQHRLFGAQATTCDVMLPVVAMTQADWLHQIYQFIVINEKAQKVDSDLLNDIFASSLTPTEQRSMRDRFVRVKVDIEQRIAGVLAGRNEDSPFYQMVRLNLPNPPAGERDAYLSQIIIQNLIDGGRGSNGWRSDDDFYNVYIRRTFPDRDEWISWRDGKWRDYWFAFWHAVIAYYTPLAKKHLSDDNFEIWSKAIQSNLTKGVGLKIFQRFFMQTMVTTLESVEATWLEEAISVFGEEKGRAQVEKMQILKSIPLTIEEFKKRVTDEFLKKFPVRFFTYKWENSLDDTTGQDYLLSAMQAAFKKDNWRARGQGVFVSGAE